MEIVIGVLAYLGLCGLLLWGWHRFVCFHKGGHR